MVLRKIERRDFIMLIKGNVLVTGAAGLLGSWLAGYLAAEGNNVYGIDNESVGFRENVPDNIKYAKIDMRWQGAMQSLIEEVKPSHIFHLASLAHEGLSQFSPRLVTENNYNIFLNLIIPTINNGLERFLFTSSTAIYGAQRPPFDEKLPLQPVDVYGVSKAATESTLAILADVHGFDYTIVRPHNIIGPRQNMSDPYRNVAAIMMNRVLQGKEPIIYGDGNQTRAFSYVDDVTPYLAKAGFLEETKGEIINIGPLEEFTINHLAETILKVAERTDLVPIHVADRPKEVKHAYCTNNKAIKLLGYKTSTKFEDGIRKMWEWAKKRGPQEFKYLDELELKGKNLPSTWGEKLL